MKFHDEYYDGIVLKIPRAIIELNDLHGLIDEIKETFEKKVTKSGAMPDNLRNIVELGQYKEKAENRNRREAERKEQFEKQQERKRKLISGELIELEWSTVDLNYRELDEVTIDGVTYSGDNLWTKRGMKEAVKKAFSEKMRSCTPDECIEFLGTLNAGEMLRALPMHLVKHKEIYMTTDSYGNIVIKGSIPYVKMYETGKRDKSNLYYRRTMLMYDKELQQYTMSGSIWKYNQQEIKSTIGKTRGVVLTEHEYQRDGTFKLKAESQKPDRQ